jgi:cardiolipin synthase
MLLPAAPLVWRRRGTLVKPLAPLTATPRHVDGWVPPPPAKLADRTLIHLYKDGEGLHAAYRAIEAARRRIWLEIYIFHSDRTGRAFADLLMQRARDGLEVRVMYDPLGSFNSDGRMFSTMRQAGVTLREFHPLRLTSLARGHIFNRDHRKLLVVDDEVAVLGGQNLGDEYGSSWISGTDDGDEWRDTAVGVRGSSVRLLADAFDRMWQYTERGGRIESAQFFQFGIGEDGAVEEIQFLERPRRLRRWRKRPPGPGPSELALPENSLAVLASVPTPRSPLLNALKKLLRDARESIDMTMAYFAPPDTLVERLCESARSGVRVRLMLPGRSDIPILVVAARAFYEKLLAAGVEIYERDHAILHAKTLCVDGCLSIVGSTNVDYRSIQYNAELSVVINSHDFGTQMHNLFEHDVGLATRIHGSKWRHRPVRDRVVQWIVLRARNSL